MRSAPITDRPALTSSNLDPKFTVELGDIRILEPSPGDVELIYAVPGCSMMA